MWKRARYWKLIRCHMDLDVIRSKIATRAIESAKQVFRDLLLVANNALPFYSKRTHEYKFSSLPERPCLEKVPAIVWRFRRQTLVLLPKYSRVVESSGEALERPPEPV